MCILTDVCVDDLVKINFNNQMGTVLTIDGPSGAGNPANIFRATGAPALFDNNDGTAVLIATFAEPKDIVSLSFETMFANFVDVEFLDSEDNQLGTASTVSVYL